MVPWQSKDHFYHFKGNAGKPLGNTAPVNMSGESETYVVFGVRFYTSLGKMTKLGFSASNVLLCQISTQALMIYLAHHSHIRSKGTNNH